MKIKRVLVLFIAICLLLGSSYLIFYGINLNKRTKANVLFGETIQSIGDFFKDDILNIVNYGNDFSVEGEATINLSSDYYSLHANDNEESLKKNNLIKNLDSLEVNYSFSHNSQTKEAYVNINETLAKENYLTYKYLIKDSTKYYQISPYVNGLINSGSCNYFERVTKTNSFTDNKEYLYNKVIEEIKESFEKETYQESYTTEDIAGNNISVKQVSLDLNKNKIKNIENRVIKEVNKDAKAKDLLDYYQLPLKKGIISNRMDDTQTYTINMYFSKWTMDLLKVEILSLRDDGRKEYNYIISDDKTIINYIVNDHLNYSFEGKITPSKQELKIYQASGEEVGYLKKKSEDNTFSIVFSLNDKHHSYDITYDSTKMQEEELTTISRLLKIRMLEDSVMHLSGEINFKEMVNLNPNNAVDTSAVRLEKTLSNEEVELVSNYQDKMKERLYR